MTMRVTRLATRTAAVAADRAAEAIIAAASLSAATRLRARQIFRMPMPLVQPLHRLPSRARFRSSRPRRRCCHCQACQRRQRRQGRASNKNSFCWQRQQRQRERQLRMLLLLLLPQRPGPFRLPAHRCSWRRRLLPLFSTHLPLAVTFASTRSLPCQPRSPIVLRATRAT